MNKVALFAVPLILVLSACGGGGGGSSPAASTPSTTQFPLASALSTFAQTSHNYTINAVNAGNTYTLQFGLTPGTPTTFKGLAASTAAETLTIRLDAGCGAKKYSDCGTRLGRQYYGKYFCIVHY